MGAFAKRIVLFLAVNLLFMITLGVVYSILALFFPGIASGGMGSLVVLGSLVGFGGALFSLMTSRWMAKRGMGVQVIDPATATGEARWLLETVYKLAKQAGIQSMPEVGIWESPEVNAFCTGPSKNSSLVAVSTGLLGRMGHDEVEGVLGHELSHATNGDMVTMTLIQGVVNTFVFIASVLITNFLRGDRDREREGFGSMLMNQLIFNVVNTVLGLVAFVVVIGPFSRLREFRADAGGAALAGKAKMIAGLQALQDTYRLSQAQPAPPTDPSLATLMVNGGRSTWFSTHPSLEERISRLQKMTLLR